MDMGTPKLNRLELGTLQYERRPSQNRRHREMHLYSCTAVSELLEKRAATLGPPQEQEPAPRDDRLHPKNDPLIDHEYATPLTALQDEPSPEDIIWDGEHINEPNILLEDAMLLYCVCLRLITFRPLKY